MARQRKQKHLANLNFLAVLGKAMWFLKLARRSRGVDERSEERGVAHHGWATPRRFWPLGGVKTRF